MKAALVRVFLLDSKMERCMNLGKCRLEKHVAAFALVAIAHLDLANKMDKHPLIRLN